MSNTDNRDRHPRKDTCSPKVYDLKKPLWTEFGKQCQKNQVGSLRAWVEHVLPLFWFLQQTSELCSWGEATTTILFQILSVYFLMFDFGCFLSSFLRELLFLYH